MDPDQDDDWEFTVEEGVEPRLVVWSRHLFRGVLLVLAGYAIWRIIGSISGPPRLPEESPDTLWATVVLCGFLLATLPVFYYGILPIIRWVSGIVDGLLRQTDKIPLDYKLADYYEKQRKWVELAETYERLRQDHPLETRPYARLVTLYHYRLGEPTAARAIQIKARLFLPKDAYLDVCRASRAALRRELPDDVEDGSQKESVSE